MSVYVYYVWQGTDYGSFDLLAGFMSREEAEKFKTDLPFRTDRKYGIGELKIDKGWGYKR